MIPTDEQMRQFEQNVIKVWCEIQEAWNNWKDKKEITDEESKLLARYNDLVLQEKEIETEKETIKEKIKELMEINKRD